MTKLINFLKFLLLIVIAFALAFLIVWPLWKFATSSPNVYTVIILVLLALFFIFLIIQGIRKHGKK